MKVRSTVHDSFEEYPENLALCSASLWQFSLEPHKGRFLAVTCHSTTPYGVDES